MQTFVVVVWLVCCFLIVYRMIIGKKSKKTHNPLAEQAELLACGCTPAASSAGGVQHDGQCTALDSLIDAYGS